MTGIITATAIVGAVGLFIGLFLGVAAIKFKVEVDEKEERLFGIKSDDLTIIVSMYQE